MPPAVRFAYYCSGHGYGHATRVSAFATSLLSLDGTKPSIWVVSSAPSHVFSECISRGARYRYVNVDPVIVQPLAYKVDRQASIQVLQRFLSEKEEKLDAEVKWLHSEQIDCVLSDAAFLACEAATKARIPSILITNFTFDSVYSYLGSEIIDSSHNLSTEHLQSPDVPIAIPDDIEDSPIPEEVLLPLVSQLLIGYRHADILILLPGFIPIPSFSNSIPLPAPTWIDSSTNRFKPGVESVLRALPTSELALCPSIPFPNGVPNITHKSTHSNVETSVSARKPPRAIKYAPLLVRPTSGDIHTLEGRSKLLSSIGIPGDLHDPDRTQILVVSFGGQKILRPQGGKSPARIPTPAVQENHATNQPQSDLSDLQSWGISNIRSGGSSRGSSLHKHSRTATQIFIPGAPAPANSPIFPEFPNFDTIARDEEQSLYGDSPLPPSPRPQDEPSLLPSPSWIAIICGVSSNWSVLGEDEELPAGFYLAPSDVYMPDLTAVADVLMGKLGYGTVSESVAEATPLVYVPRPLFVEEHGLRLFLEAEGVGVELSRHEYESGGWANKVEEAYLKSKKRGRVRQNDSYARQVKELASWVVESVEEWRTR